MPLFTTSTFQLSPVYYDYQARLSWRPSARDVVDLSVMSQKQIVEDLQMLAAQRATAGADAV